MRVKGGVVTRRRHKRLLKLSEGFKGRRRNCYRLAKLAVQRSLKYSYRDRRVRKREFRALWITRVNAAARVCGLSYSRFIRGLAQAGIELDRRVLADIAMRDPNMFAAVAEQARSALERS